MAFIYLLWDSKSFRHFRSSLSRPSALVPLTLRRISDNGRTGPPRPVSSEKVRDRAHPPDRSPIRTTAAGRPAEHCRVRASPRSMLSCISPPSADGPRPFFGKETVPEGDKDDSAPRCHRIPTAAGPVTHRSAAPSASSFPANRTRKGNRNAPTAATVRSGSGHTRRYGPIQ